MTAVWSILRRSIIPLAFTAALCVVLTGCITSSGTLPLKADGTYEQEIVDDAVSTLHLFLGPDAPGSVQLYLEKARGLLIIPSLVNGGFILGVRGGTGLLFAKGPAGDWSPPVFMNITGASWGFQAGAQQTAIIMAFMTDKALQGALHDNGSAGLQVAVAAGPTGTGDEYSTLTRFQRDEVFYAAMNKGFYFGGTVQVASLAPRGPMNSAYYGPRATPEDILFARSADNPGVRRLVTELNNATYGLDTPQ